MRAGDATFRTWKLLSVSAHMFDILANPEVLEQIKLYIAEGRPQLALEALNEISPYRFTALFQIDGSNLHNLLIYDKEIQRAPRLESIQLSDSYCIFVKEQQDAFIVSDSEQDVRVADHPKRPVVHSYCGVPIKTINGQVFGTLCHFDYDPISQDDESVKWLEAVAELFDPKVSAEMMARGVKPKIEALDAIAQLLHETYENPSEVRAAFEHYARPVRDQLQKLPAHLMDEIDRQIDQILSRVSPIPA